MNATSAGPAWPIRLLRASSVLLLAGALIVWFTPINVPGKNLQPFGCGSPASPVKSKLAELICQSDLAGTRLTIFALLASAAVLLLISEQVARLVWDRAWFRGVAAILPLAVPLAALSVAALFSPVGTEGADGSLIRCGTAVRPSADPFVRGTCGQLPERQRTLAFGGAALSILLIAAAGYVGTKPVPRDHDDESGDAVEDLPGDEPGGSDEVAHDGFDHEGTHEVGPDSDPPIIETRRSRL
ncbi:hypothetical protein JNB_03745 [Janibacter sp. HTCC2649]|uniref:hypothetical protein n=1 Tax=Janibacter sp. HTCC2649 TaxID=313589 RepID=UPI000066E96F|nr:hypothetical protein [Janibacter sp. HTCC2649]EAP99251.1 hypothetical protein JNB_03745 [Janibacter sp. HTCC2649]